MLRLLTGSVLGTAMLLLQSSGGCDTAPTEGSKAASGAQQVSTRIEKGADGLTVEQRNVKSRLEMDNKPGSIKHLYIISPISGQVILYSTVKGKVTSSGKRLTPTQVAAGCAYQEGCWGAESNVGRTPEILQDDGTYGNSSEYLYWWDVQGRYHQIYPGGVFIQLSDQPLPVKSITINLETQP